MQMRRQHSGRVHRAALRRCWCRWTAIVELFARGRPARRRVNPRAYRVLHQDLLDACQSAAAGSPKQAFFEGLDDLARPWLTLRVLQQTEPEILFDLLVRCQEAERVLVGGAWVWWVRRAVRPLLVGLVTVLLVVLGVGVWNGVGPQVQEWLRQGEALFGIAARVVPSPEAWLVAGLVIVGVLMLLVARVARH
jgi:hypothetical protein